MVAISYALAVPIAVGVVYFLVRDRTGWMGFPIAVVLVRAFQQCVVSPIVSPPDQVKIISAYTRTLRPLEAESATVMVMVGYVGVLVGLAVSGVFARGGGGQPPATDWIAGRKASLLIFAVGVVAHLVVIYFLTRSRGLFSLAQSRALFTDDVAEQNAVFGNAVLMSEWALVGALGMLMFSGDVRRLSLGGGAAIALISCIHVLHGSRGAVLKTIMMAALVYMWKASHYRGRFSRISVVKVMVGASVVVAVMLVGLTMLRYSDASTPAAALLRLASKIAADTSINEAGSIVGLCPDKVPYQGGETYIKNLPRLLPGVRVPDVDSAYSAVVTATRGSEYVKATGGAGETFCTAAEAYLNFGYLGVFAVPVVIGVVSGVVFRKQQQCSTDPSIAIFTIVYWSAFVSAIDAKATDSLFPLALGALVPAALIAAWGRRRRRARLVFLCIGLAGSSMVVWKLTGLVEVRAISSASLLLTYLASIVLLYERAEGGKASDSKCRRIGG